MTKQVQFAAPANFGEVLSNAGGKDQCIHAAQVLSQGANLRSRSPWTVSFLAISTQCNTARMLIKHCGTLQTLLHFPKGNRCDTLSLVHFPAADSSIRTRVHC